MFEYKGTENFDIGAGYGNLEYDFFKFNDEDDFWELMNYYEAIYMRFNYFLDGYKVEEGNTDLSPVVRAKMMEHKANICLTLLEEQFKNNNVIIREMVVNVQKPNKMYETYFFNFYHFAAVRARDYLERGRAYSKSGLGNAAIIYFSQAIELDPNLGHAFIERGISYLDGQNYNKAIEDFTQALNLNTEKSVTLSLRGLTYKEAGDFDKAKEDLVKALKLNPNNEIAREYLEEINNADSKS